MAAVATALARAADGRLAIPIWLAGLVQGGAIAWWIHSRCGWLRAFGLRERPRPLGPVSGPTGSHPQAAFAPAPPAFVDRAVTALALAGGAGLAIRARNADVFLAAATAFLAGQLLVEWGAAWYRRTEENLDRPAAVCRAAARPWIAGVLVTTLLLSIPISTESGVPDYRHNFWLHVSSCAVTAVSAACLVGNSIYSFREDFTLFGQAVLLVTTQAAGLALSAIGLAMVRPFLNRTVSLRAVWGWACLLQMAGAAAMATAWRGVDAPTAADRAGWSIVYATDGIWNCGWTMRPNGLADYLGSPLVFTAVTTLSIIGSLGLPILMDLIGLGGRGRPPREPTESPPRHGLRTAAFEEREGWPLKKLSGWEAAAAFALLVGAAILVFVLETPRFLPESLVPSRPVDFGSHQLPIRDEPQHGDRWRTAVFVSATIRSAGIQSVPLASGAVSWPTLGVLLSWMLIGGSAGGIAGGMRTTVIVMLAMLLLHPARSWHSGSRGASPRRIIVRALLSWGVIWPALSGLAVAALSMTAQGTLYEWLLEAIAATNGVGLSTGLTLHLTWAGRLVIIAAMTAGLWIPAFFWAWLTQRLVVASGREE